MVCKKSTDTKYLKRKGPPYPAQNCPGMSKKGNDGLMYKSEPNKNDVYRWMKKSSRKSSIKSVRKSSRKSVRKSVRKSSRKSVRKSKLIGGGSTNIGDFINVCKSIKRIKDRLLELKNILNTKNINLDKSKIVDEFYALQSQAKSFAEKIKVEEEFKQKDCSSNIKLIKKMNVFG